FEGAVNMARDMYNAIYSPLMKLAQYDIRGEQMKTVIPEENRKLIESEVQQSKSADITLTEPIAPLGSSKVDTQPLLLPADKPLHRESEVQQSKSADITLAEPIAPLESSKVDTQPLLLPADKPLHRESEVQQSKSADITLAEPIAPLESSKVDTQPLLLPADKPLHRESEVQQSKSADITLAEPIAPLESSKVDTQPLLLPADKPLNRESEVQQLKFVDITSTEPIAPLEISKIDTQPLPQWQQLGGKFSAFLEHLPKYLGKFSTEYQLPILYFSAIITVTIAVKIILAVLDVINEIPQVSLALELTGIGYLIWFVFRYLFKASTRQELAAQLSFIQKEIVEGQD
ncbi:CAAD domain-containing protein, partial [Nostoc sp.]|uniref:CAAD domain-containing protein n=1 Tax=Nostoc sp. TaxID=1180 RepID=UPI002FF721A8